MSKTIPSSWSPRSIGDLAAGRPILAADALGLINATHHLYQRLGARCQMFDSRIVGAYETDSSSYTTVNSADAAWPLNLHQGVLTLTRNANDDGDDVHYLIFSAVGADIEVEITIYAPDTDEVIATMTAGNDGATAAFGTVATISAADADAGGVFGSPPRILAASMRARINPLSAASVATLERAFLYETYIDETELPTSIAEAPSSPPTLLTSPVASGTVRRGELLSCTTGTWANTPSSYTYQWTRGGVDISGATSSTYTVVAADIPELIACEVTAINGAGSSTPAPSNNLASPLKPIYDLDANARVWVHTQGPDASVGNPVSVWESADGAWDLVQPTGTNQPTRQSDGIDFDGVDNWMTADDSASILNGAYTVCDGFKDVGDSDTNTRQLWGNYTDGVSTATRRCSHVNLSRPGSANTTRMRYLLGANSSATVISLTSLSSLGAAGPYHLAFRSPAPGSGSAEALQLTDPLAPINTGAWATVGMANDLHTVGAQRINSAVAPLLPWQGTLFYHVILTYEASDADLDEVRDALAAEGVL